MKTIVFNCNGHNAPAYGCNKPGDNSGEYVPAEAAKSAAALVIALRLNSELWNLQLPDEIKNLAAKAADELGI